MAHDNSTPETATECGWPPPQASRARGCSRSGGRCQSSAAAAYEAAAAPTTDLTLGFRCLLPVGSQQTQPFPVKSVRHACAPRAVATGLQALLSRFLRPRRSWHDPNGLPLWSSAPQKGRASHTVVLVRGTIDAARSTSQRAGARASARGLLGQCMGRSGGPAFSGASPSWAS